MVNGSLLSFAIRPLGKRFFSLFLTVVAHGQNGFETLFQYCRFYCIWCPAMRTKIFPTSDIIVSIIRNFYLIPTWQTWTNHHCFGQLSLFFWRKKLRAAWVFETWYVSCKHDFVPKVKLRLAVDNSGFSTLDAGHCCSCSLGGEWEVYLFSCNINCICGWRLRCDVARFRIFRDFHLLL